MMPLTFLSPSPFTTLSASLLQTYDKGQVCPGDNKETKHIRYEREVSCCNLCALVFCFSALTEVTISRKQCFNTIKANFISDDEQAAIRSDLLPTSINQIVSHYQQHQTIIPFLQSEITSQINKQRFKTNLTNAKLNDNNREAARLLAISADGASLWKTTTPSTTQSTLSDLHYQIAAKLTLGVLSCLSSF